MATSLADKMRKLYPFHLDRWIKRDILYFIKESARNGHLSLDLSQYRIDSLRRDMERDLFDELVISWLTHPENGFLVTISNGEIVIEW